MIPYNRTVFNAPCVIPESFLETMCRSCACDFDGCVGIAWLQAHECIMVQNRKYHRTLIRGAVYVSKGYGSRERAILEMVDRHPNHWVRLTRGLTPSAAAAQRRAARRLASAGVIDLERRKKGLFGCLCGCGSWVVPTGYWRPGSCRLSPPHLSMTRAMRLSRFL